MSERESGFGLYGIKPKKKKPRNIDEANSEAAKKQGPPIGHKGASRTQET